MKDKRVLLGTAVRPNSSKRIRPNSSMDDVTRHMKKMVAELDESNVVVRCNRVINKINKVIN